MQLGCVPRQNKIGVLLAQLGTPDAPDKSALRRYLKEFLSDRRVIEKNRLVWWLILNGIILNVRPARSAALYKRIWREDGSPLLIYTQRQAQFLKEQFNEEEIEVEFGMRYGNPSLDSAVEKLVEKNCRRILLVPLYAHYAGATVGSTYDAVFRAVLRQRWVPTLRVMEPYFRHPEYLASWAEIINHYYDSAETKPERLVLSYHGIPYEYVKKGDPYCCQCVENTQALLPLLKFPTEQVVHTFQSRFGKDPWLEPYTDETIEDLGDKGVRHIAVACPGFITDCLETLDEIGNEGLHQFQEHGGERLDLIPCLNDHPRWLKGLEQMIRSELESWVDLDLACKGQTGKVVCPMSRLSK